MLSYAPAIVLFELLEISWSISGEMYTIVIQVVLTMRWMIPHTNNATREWL